MVIKQIINMYNGNEKIIIMIIVIMIIVIIMVITKILIIIGVAIK